MTNRILLAVELLLVLAGGLTMQGCFEEHRYGPSSYAPAPYPAYGPYGVYSYGDYDRDRQWHNSDWWADHDRDWTQQHHPDWVTTRHHDNDRSHERDRDHGGQDHDQDHAGQYGHDNR